MLINKSDNDVQETFLLYSHFIRRSSWLVVRVPAGIIIVLLCTYKRSVIKKKFCVGITNECSVVIDYVALWPPSCVSFCL